MQSAEDKCRMWNDGDWLYIHTMWPLPLCILPVAPWELYILFIVILNSACLRACMTPIHAVKWTGGVWMRKVYRSSWSRDWSAWSDVGTAAVVGEGLHGQSQSLTGAESVIVAYIGSGCLERSPVCSKNPKSENCCSKQASKFDSTPAAITTYLQNFATC